VARQGFEVGQPWPELLVNYAQVEANVQTDKPIRSISCVIEVEPISGNRGAGGGGDVRQRFESCLVPNFGTPIQYDDRPCVVVRCNRHGMGFL
jgi:hypothetical protein